MADQKIDHSKKDEKNEALLEDFCRAAKRNNLEKAKLAINNGLPLNQALNCAMAFQAAPILGWVLEQKADPNRFEGEIAPLHRAVFFVMFEDRTNSPDLTMIKLLLEAQADIHLKSKEDEPKTARQTVANYLDLWPDMADLHQLLLDAESIQAAPTSPPAPRPFDSSSPPASKEF